MKLSLIIVLLGTTIAAAETAPPQLSSPHGDATSCDACHVASVSELKDPAVSPVRKKLLAGGPNGVCRKCHTVDLGHGVGRKPAQNIHSLPLAEDGTITCAVTCHDIHLSKPETVVQRKFFLRYSHQKLCASCHNQ